MRERRVLIEDRALEFLQSGVGVEPKLLREHALALPVDVERVCLAPGSIEGEHELAAQALAERMSADERLELGNELSRTAELELGVDLLLERGESKLLDPAGLDLAVLGVRELRERGPSPEAERRREPLSRALGLARRKEGARLPDESLEVAEIELVAVDLERVAAVASNEAFASERLAERRDVDVDAVQGARGWTLAPEHVDQPIRRNRSAGMQQEHREERALLGTAEREGLSVLVRLERAEDSEVDHRIDPGPSAARSNIAITRQIKRRSTLPQGQLKPQNAHSRR